jgi:hypothetical protein
MSYNNLIDGQLNKAFILLKDLAKPMIFTEVAASDFNFGTGEVTKTSAAPKTIKVVAIEDNRPSKDKKTIKKTILASKRDIVDLSLYDLVSFESQNWKVGNIIRESGRIWMFEIVREA